ncbi:MAG TPA: hypothetical protein DG761_01040 [Gammaproteobacteria bacterium]|nr:hypothetical protein [Gammaproteobacteria bacterium]
MPLNLQMGGEGAAYIRFKPTENAWLMSGPDGPTEFEFDDPVVIDIENVQLGWLHLGVGISEWEEWPNNVKTEKPAEGEFKVAAKVKFFSKKLFGENGVRELRSNQAGVMQFIQDLYADAEANFNKGVPVVEITGSNPVKIGKGSTRIPQYLIKKFVARPDALANGHVEPEESESADADDDDEF